MPPTFLLRAWYCSGDIFWPLRMPLAFAMRMASSSERAAEKSKASRKDCFLMTTVSSGFLELLLFF